MALPELRGLASAVRGRKQASSESQEYPGPDPHSRKPGWGRALFIETSVSKRTKPRSMKSASTPSLHRPRPLPVGSDIAIPAIEGEWSAMDGRIQEYPHGNFARVRSLSTSLPGTSRSRPPRRGSFWNGVPGCPEPRSSGSPKEPYGDRSGRAKGGVGLCRDLDLPTSTTRSSTRPVMGPRNKGHFHEEDAGQHQRP